ncbi:MAG: AgmX/PglI C-terminal domain-containing protein [Thermodesulfovibrionales bacterium]|nr:AgmX/PglI C-terminal domain-containing protein [Thermodesulfovibrionales bacterium]
MRRLIQSPVLTNIEIDFGTFQVYDVEPPSIPDVLAERPVIVFGKWRGRPQGRITLKGVTGDEPYTDTIDVKSVKPAKENSALRYLWARHRIALLSDYNKLRPDDERIQEVTSLGLAYNLLTAYTSFIAVDTEVRNKDGQVTTVRQPLPLPEGVSDYAVGGVAKESLASAPSLMRTQAGKDEKKREEESDKPGSKGQREFKIGEVAVSRGGLSKTAIQKTIEQHIDEIRACIAKCDRQDKLVIQLIIRPNGTIKMVKVIRNESQNTDAEQCIIRQIKPWKFPVSPAGRETEATIHLVMGT